MNKTIIIIAVAFLGVAQAASTVRVQCQSATTSVCASGFQFVVTGSNLNTKYCLPVGKTCNVGSFDNNVVLTNCTVDYKNSPCTTNICYSTVINK